jgi:hypothetical protein
MTYLSVYLLIGLLAVVFQHSCIKLLTDLVRDGGSEGLERHFGTRTKEEIEEATTAERSRLSLSLYLILTTFYLVLWPVPLLHKIFR